MAIETAERVRVGSEEITFAVTSRESGGALLAFEVTMPPGGGPPGLHRHEAAELYRVDAGKLAFYVAGEDGSVARSVAGAGASVAIPGGREHTIRNESPDEARALVVFAPGSAMERFIRAAGALAERGAPSMDDVLALAAAHGVDMTRPLPEAA